MIHLGRGHLRLCRSSLFCLLLSCVSAEGIIATVGTDVTLICNYDAKYYGKLPACWGRGAIPNRGCAGEVIRSDGLVMVSRLSERYLFMGLLDEGDVSLTIRQVEESDSGIYGCRVEIPGWFNDHKHQQTLTVMPVRPNPLKVETREVKERTVTVRWTPVFDGGRPITTYRIDLKNKQASWDTAVTTEVYNPELTQLTLVDLRPAKTYNLRMFAINDVGISEPSNVLTIMTKEAAPEGPPLDMQLETLSSHSIKVTWKPPRPDLRNGVLRSYSISYREYDPHGRQFKRWQHLSVTATRDVESIVLSNLRSSAFYGVLIQAKTNAGIGPASTAPLCSTLDEVHKTSTPSTAIRSTSTAGTRTRDNTSFITPHTTSSVEAATVWEEGTTSTTSVPPDPPVVEIKEVKGSTISLLWTAGFEGDSPIIGFYLEYKAVNASWDHRKTVVDFSPDQTEATIIEINPSTYNIRMFAESSVGTSKASNILTITTGETGHQSDYHVTTTSTDTHAAASVEEGQSGGKLAAILLPVMLAVLIVAIVTAWQLRRIKQKNGSLNVWLSGGVLRYKGAESLQEL
ncbi:Down syndrome cell adhesion molecule-like protein 1 homolog isoform X2 [Notolabrus celidotus]|uniref:Down syndrome cell adhesion molecule-like protein 1 homolog isoform X2 n=1 Tax=Notolabrus celidotus TaxID=1203425 RepID=UPI00148FEB0F|nr:Down syndrome cell adhesion molecule-like protein 1 homolog isoform X2 [Notolabrus celidotus]